MERSAIRRGLNTADKAFRRLQGSHSEAFSLPEVLESPLMQGKERKLKSSRATLRA